MTFFWVGFLSRLFLREEGKDKERNLQTLDRMADPLLSSLCTICHTDPPKYVCPACSAGTCSLPCNKKHKAWANCSGKRDPTAYMPASKLKTPAGVDHDYNFLSGIERERDRNQREVVEEKGLFSQREVREMDNEKRWRKMWFGEEVRFVATGDRARGYHNHHHNASRSDGEEEDEQQQLGGRDGDDEGRGYERRGGGKMSALARKIRARLEQAGTHVVQMPTGMVRQRENTTAWNRRTGGINWCVEWIVYEPEDESGEAVKKSTRIRHKALESIPLYKALGDSMAWFRRGQTKGEDQDDEDAEDMSSLYARKRRRVLIREVKEEGRRSAMQDHDEATWLSTPYPTQNPYTGAWNADRGAMVSSWLADAETGARRNHRFYLLRPLTPAGKPKELIPLDGAETLASALQGRTVLEYPTIYVLPPSATASLHPSGDLSPLLPEGYLLGSTERRAPQPRKPRPEKRKAPEQNANSTNKTEGPSQKRQALSGNTQQRGGRGIRGAAAGGRGRLQGRGGRELGANHRPNQRRGGYDDAAEEGEIHDDGDEVADTTSSDPDTSSSDEEEGSLRGFGHDDEERHMDIDSGIAATHNSTFGSLFTATTAAATTTNPTGKIARFTTTQQPKKAGLGLVDYGSDSDDDEDEEGEDDGEPSQDDVDLSKLNPENPELVAGAIQEIVGLLS